MRETCILCGTSCTTCKDKLSNSVSLNIAQRNYLKDRHSFQLCKTCKDKLSNSVSLNIAQRNYLKDRHSFQLCKTERLFFTLCKILYNRKNYHSLIFLGIITHILYRPNRLRTIWPWHNQRVCICSYRLVLHIAISLHGQFLNLKPDKM